VIANARNEWIRSTEKLVASELDRMSREADEEESEGHDGAALEDGAEAST